MAGGMTMQDYANLGAAALTGNPAYTRPLQGQSLHARKDAGKLKMLAAYAVPTKENYSVRIDGQPVVGFSMPATTFDKMKQINGSALALNFDIERNITSKHPNGDQFKASWNNWFAGWQNFFNRYQEMANKFLTLFDSDSVAAQTESYRLQLMGDPSALPKPITGWVDAYTAEGTSETPVPPTTAIHVPRAAAPSAGAPPPPEEGLPWWVLSLLVIGGVSVIAGSVFIVRRKLIQAQEADRIIRRDVLPMVLGSAMGPTGIAFAHAAANNTHGIPTQNDPSAFLGGPAHGAVYFVG